MQRVIRPETGEDPSGFGDIRLVYQNQRKRRSIRIFDLLILVRG
jgi:hypothetical protein